jgi:hypothetical protein
VLRDADLARHNTRSAGTSKVGGRVDIAKDINEIKFTASLTDATARDYEATPWIRDFIVTAEKKLNCTLPLLPRCLSYVVCVFLPLKINFLGKVGSGPFR